jgi:small-conductance mechanosensitive channel
METALIAAKEIADTCIQNGHILADPEPRAYYDGFNEAVNLRLAVWFERSKLIDTKNAVYTTAVKVFQKYGVVIPFTRYDIKIVPDEQPGSKKAKKSESKPEPPALISKKSEKIEAIAEKPKASVRKSTKKSV